MNPFVILGINENCSEEQLKQTFMSQKCMYQNLLKSRNIKEQNEAAKKITALTKAYKQAKSIKAGNISLAELMITQNAAAISENSDMAQVNAFCQNVTDKQVFKDEQYGSLLDGDEEDFQDEQYGTLLNEAEQDFQDEQYESLLNGDGKDFQDIQGESLLNEDEQDFQDEQYESLLNGDGRDFQDIQGESLLNEDEQNFQDKLLLENSEQTKTVSEKIVTENRTFKQCPKCGIYNDSDAVFCKNCAQRFIEDYGNENKVQESKQNLYDCQQKTEKVILREPVAKNVYNILDKNESLELIEPLDTLPIQQLEDPANYIELQVDKKKIHSEEQQIEVEKEEVFQDKADTQSNLIVEELNEDESELIQKQNHKDGVVETDGSVRPSIELVKDNVSLREREENTRPEKQDGKIYNENTAEPVTVWICPQCNLENESQVAFCTQCGYRFNTEYSKTELDKICQKCGAVNEKDAVFCTQCGYRFNTGFSKTELDKNCQKCGAINEKDAVFCTQCGYRFNTGFSKTELEKICQKCGAVNEKDAVFCTHCGNHLPL
ncbi:MAG: zinc-ribbon domain-containing protein [Acidaminococcaceae bacterium]|nr:zinc-ribbon domain-containing protein [Acidaminococcaceae bacterium]